jgi:hypothetical protein
MLCLCAVNIETQRAIIGNYHARYCTDSVCVTYGILDFLDFSGTRGVVRRIMV